MAMTLIVGFAALVPPTLGAQDGKAVAGLARADDLTGMQIVRRSLAAHGGSVYEDLSTISASFTGRWGKIGPRVQPILADQGFRVASEERYLLREQASFQWHVGPDGEKIVFRDEDEVAVHYNGRPTRDPNRISASAATADLYEFLLLGPSWLTQREISARVLEDKQLGGESHARVEAVIRPGIGHSDEDRLILWFNRGNYVLQRVETTLDGYPPLKGRLLEITLGGHEWLADKLWPTEFLQRVDAKVKVVYHRWQMTGFEVDRTINKAGLSEIRRSALDLDALRPAKPIEFSGKP